MPQYWYIVEALLTLARVQRQRTRTFTRADLIAWSPRFQQRTTGAQLALDHLAAAGLVRRITVKDGAQPDKKGAWTYVLTPEGAAAGKAACDAHKHAALSAAAKKGVAMRPRLKGTFAAKLWALLRLRQVLTAPEAAATLVDAGGNVAVATSTASKYLLLWTQLRPDAIQISGQKLKCNTNRFVLIKDIGPDAPKVTYPKKAQGGAAA
ncbi:MAG TPA: hypothetical protein VLJ86_05545 [Ramlibacter sp.]|nr:hypothetical protein [Ramlibacter sp.]